MKNHKEDLTRSLFLTSVCFTLAMTLSAASTAFAQDLPAQIDLAERAVMAPNPLVYIIPGEDQISTLYHDGSQIVIHTEERWRPMCGADLTGLTIEDIRRAAEAHHAAFADGPTVIVDSGLRGSGLNIIYNCDASVPTDALGSFAIAEAYLESLFSDNITVTMSCNFDSLGGSTLGFTNSNTISGVNYRNSRLGLQYGMDGDDVIQDWLPAGNTCPVRYNGSSATVTNENTIVWNKAPYKATVGTATGNDASMSYNTDFQWDYNPAGGVAWNSTSLVDVVCHETGHALGFTSATDIGGYMEVLDLFRFCRQDGDYDYNPDTYAEFQTTPRIVSYNNPNDEQNTDGIDFSHRMEDGSPYQASHLRQYNDNGCMVPTIGNGETRYPNYYTEVDTNCFDAIGWDYPPCTSPQFIEQPEVSQAYCAGENATLSVTVDVPSAAYQWRRGPDALVNDGVHVFGATTDTLTLVNLTVDDASTFYSCFVHNNADGCPGISDWAEIIVDTDVPVFTQQPTDVEIDAGDTAMFQVGVENSNWVDFQWRKGETPLSDDGRIIGATTYWLIITNTTTADAGEYNCLVTRRTGSFCEKVSDPATLTINAGPQDCPNPGGAGEYCSADIDGSADCIVNLSDLATLLANYGMTSGATRLDGDVDPAGGDGDVDLGDLAALLAQYGNDCN